METITLMPSFFDSIDLMIERPTHCILLKENWLKMDSSCPKIMSGREFGGLHTLRFSPNSVQNSVAYSWKQLWSLTWNLGIGVESKFGYSNSKPNTKSLVESNEINT